MDFEFIENAVADIMRADGPDGHTDGSDVITEFIQACLEGNGYSWIATYREKHAQNLNKWNF